MIFLSEDYMYSVRYLFHQFQEVVYMEWVVEADIKRNADPEGSMIDCICVTDVCIAYLPCKTVF
jgi:hypothetical protein